MSDPKRRERGIDWYVRQIVPDRWDDNRFVPPRDPFHPISVR